MNGLLPDLRGHPLSSGNNTLNSHATVSSNPTAGIVNDCARYFKSSIPERREEPPSDSSDYVRDLIRRDQERQLSIAEIQKLVDEGLASGSAEPFDAEDFLTSKRAAHVRSSG